MNIKHSNMNFARGEIVATARAYFTVKNMDANSVERMVLEHEFRRVIGNATQMIGGVSGIDSLDLEFIAQLVMVMGTGSLMAD